jgi:hypothetical protein
MHRVNVPKRISLADNPSQHGIEEKLFHTAAEFSPHVENTSCSTGRERQCCGWVPLKAKRQTKKTHTVQEYAEQIRFVFVAVALSECATMAQRKLKEATELHAYVCVSNHPDLHGGFTSMLQMSAPRSRCTLACSREALTQV